MSDNTLTGELGLAPAFFSPHYFLLPNPKNIYKSSKFEYDLYNLQLNVIYYYYKKSNKHIEQLFEEIVIQMRISWQT